MVIETVLFISCVIIAGVAIAKVYKASQDVLYGPYMKRVNSRGPR